MKVKTAFFDYPLWIWVLIWVVFAVLARQTEAQDSSYSYWNKGHPQYGLLHEYFFPYHKARPVFRRSTLTIRYDKKLVGTLLGQRIWEAANDINKEICFKAPYYNHPEDCLVIVAPVPSKEVVCEYGDGISDIFLKTHFATCSVAMAMTTNNRLFDYL